MPQCANSDTKRWQAVKIDGNVQAENKSRKGGKKDTVTDYYLNDKPYTAKAMYYVICNFTVEGFHRWESAPDRLFYLRQLHRHVFFIKARFEVKDGDREIEIIEAQNKIKEYLYSKYGNPCMFNGMSCEHIAKDISDKFSADEVEVLEDGFGGALYRRTK